MKEKKFRLPTKCQNGHFRWEFVSIDFPENGMIQREWGLKNCDCDTHGIDKGFSSCCVGQQFTGILDKNGIEVYEGDLIKYREFYPFEVFFGKYEWLLRNKIEERDFFSVNINEIEIVGNIYEESYKDYPKQ